MFKGLIEKVVDFTGDVLRNTPSIVVSQELLDDLSSSPCDRAFGEAAVSATAPAEVSAFISPVIMRPFTYGTPLTDPPAVLFPSRFSSGIRFGAWCGSLDLLTTVYETVHYFMTRMRNMLTEVPKEVVSERRVFRVAVRGILVDFRGKHRDFPKLLDKEDYSLTHALGDYLFDNGQRGLLVESVRHREGTNLAAFSPEILSNPRHDSYLSYRWMPGETAVKIERPPGRSWKTIRL